MTAQPRLVHEMTERAAGLRARADGYRIAGSRRLARLCMEAATGIDMALTALTELAAAERTE